MNEIMIALLALLVGATFGGVMPWAAYRLGKRNGYAEGVAKAHFSSSSSPDYFSSVLPLILMATMPKGGIFSDYSQTKKDA